jgi:hypothetical protein
VALSRCTSLDGLVLHSRIHPGAIRTDQQVQEFSSGFHKEDELELLLDGEKMVFWAEQLLKLFGAEKILIELQQHAAWLRDKKMNGMESAVTLSRGLQQRGAQLHEVGLKFRQQLDPLLKDVLLNGNTSLLKERVGKAVAYFTNEIYEGFIQPIRRERDLVKSIAKVKKYVLQLSGLEHFLWNRLQLFADASYGNLKFNEGLPDYGTLRAPANEEKAKEKEKAGKKREAGGSRRGTLELYLAGKSLAEISAERGLALSTVESHLADCVANDELQVNRFVGDKKLAMILPLVKELGVTASGPIKARLGEDVTWAEIRAVQAHWRRAME